MCPQEKQNIFGEQFSSVPSYAIGVLTFRKKILSYLTIEDLQSTGD